MFFHLAIAVCFVLLFGSCVSFRINSLRDRKAEKVEFTPPPLPYKKAQHTNLDALWENAKNKSSLSFFSNCSSSLPFTSLKDLQENILSDLRSFYIFNREKKTHQGQPARYLKLTELNPKKRKKQIELFLFKKGSCFYVLNFIFPKQAKATVDKTIFNNFINAFRVP